MKSPFIVRFGRRLSFVLSVLFLFVVAACGNQPTSQTNTRVYKIGEVSNIGGGPAPAAAATQEAPATPTPIPTPAGTPAAGVTTNGQLASRQASFHEALEALGYVEGQNVTYIAEAPTTDPTGLDTAVQNLVAQNVDIIIAYGTTASQAAKRGTAESNIPVVFVGALEPVQLGLVTSLQNTEGNVTGVGGVSDAYAKQLEWLLNIDPTIRTVYFPYTSLNNPLVAFAEQAIKAYAENSGLELIEQELPTPDDANAVIADMPDVDAIILTAFSPFGFIQAAVDHSIPLAYGFPNAMDLGPLLSYNYTEADVGSAAARYADRILKGAKPSDLPVEIAANSLALNLVTAQAIGLTIPDDIIAQADIVVR